MNNADILDQANEIEQFFTNLALSNFHHAEILLDNPLKECLNCSQSLVSGRFCDIECRDEYQEYHKKIETLYIFEGK